MVTGRARGGLGLAYHWGSTDAVKVHLAVKSDWSLKPIYDVVAMLPGNVYPDQWVVRGNHRDGWVFGAADPLSGQVALMSEAKALGALYRSGWRPARTIVYTSWDAEEPSLLGSTEWVETHADELAKKRSSTSTPTTTAAASSAPRAARNCSISSTRRRTT